jgi:hypothetical protein
MAARDDKRPPGGVGQGAKPARPLARELTLGFPTNAKIARTRRTSRPRPPVETIEDRLVSKAEAADRRDYTGERSLGEMSREEMHKFLFGTK